MNFQGLVLLCLAATCTLAKPNADGEFCTVATETVHANTPELLLQMNAVVRRPYFRYFKVNLNKECPYWAVSLLCSNDAGKSLCQLCRCDPQEVPVSLRSDTADMGSLATEDDSAANREGLPRSPQKLEEMLGVGSVGDDTEAEWFDLVKNPEGNTGYTGAMANRIWKTIYEENCFTESNNLECSEQKVFYQLISGLQSSISAMVGSYFFHATSQTQPESEMLPNCELLSRMVSSHPDRVANLHTLYLFVLRAVSLARDHYTKDMSMYDTGNAYEDEQLKREIHGLFRAHLLCSNTFNETLLLETERGKNLIPEMKRMMSNITTLMDCVACEKCRLWGKLQTRALATAFEIVTSRNDRTMTLSRGELVSMMNFLRQVAQAVYNVRNLCPGFTGGGKSNDEL